MSRMFPIVCALLAFWAVPVSAQPIRGVFKIAAKHSNKLLDVNGGPGAVSDAADIQQFGDFGNGNQMWLIVPVSNGEHKLLALHSGKALDVMGASTQDGARIQQFAYNDTPNQKWRFVSVEPGYFRIEASHSGKVLDVLGGPGATNDGAKVQQFAYNGGDNQKWRLIPVGNAVAGAYRGPSGFGRGMQATSYCGNSPESWVRGNVALDANSGVVSMEMELETDSTAAGPKGKLVARLKDDTGAEIAIAQSEEALTGGKGMGTAARRRRSGQASVPVAVAKRTAYINLEAQCTGSHTRVFDITLDTVTDVIKIAVALVP